MPSPAADWIPTAAIAQGRAPDVYGPLRDFPSLGRYQTWRYIGGGNFGKVFTAVHGELGRIQAVKRVEIADREARQLALAEARTMANLPPHPHLVTLFDVEEAGSGVYMVLQYIDGATLEAARAPVDVHRALAWVRDTAEALSMVHAHGIVHRDVKPGNVFATRHDDAVLGDFGVARPVASADRRAAIAGTPAYMAPEAFAGVAGPASDLWSLGVLLYELVVGQRPFAHIEGAPLVARAAALADARFALPSTVNPGVPGKVDDLVVNLLAYRAEDRLPTAMAVLDHLPRYETVVSALQADITRLAVDAIVVSSNERLAMNIPGSAAHAVLLAGGQSIQEEAAAHAPAPVGSVVVTHGGALPSRHVLHAVTQQVDARGFLVHAHERDLRKALWGCFRKAHELRLRSIALPALGVHTGGLPPEEAARMMVDVTHTYLLEFRPPLERVTFAVVDKMVALAFREAALERGMLLV